MRESYATSLVCFIKSPSSLWSSVLRLVNQRSHQWIWMRSQIIAVSFCPFSKHISYLLDTQVMMEGSVSYVPFGVCYKS